MPSVLSSDDFVLNISHENYCILVQTSSNITLQHFNALPCRDAALGRPLVLDGVPGLRLVSDVTGRAGLPAADQENEDVVQAPPAQNHEVLLQH